MITAEIRVSGRLIAHVYCVNEEPVPGPGNRWDARDTEWYRYSYEYLSVGEGAKGVINGEVKHFRPNGAAALMKEIFEDVETKGGK